MMAGIIVVGSIALALAYTLIWWLRPDLRRRIEAPGQRFAADARRYDRTCVAVKGPNANARHASAQPADARHDAARQLTPQDRQAVQENTEPNR